MSICLNTLYITVLHNQFCSQRYQGCNVTTPKEFLFVEDPTEVHGHFRYKPVDNPSMCLGKDNCKLSVVMSGTDNVQRPCAFKLEIHRKRR